MNSFRKILLIAASVLGPCTNTQTTPRPVSATRLMILYALAELVESHTKASTLYQWLFPEKTHPSLKAPLWEKILLSTAKALLMTKLSKIKRCSSQHLYYIHVLMQFDSVIKKILNGTPAQNLRGDSLLATAKIHITMLEVRP